MKLALDVTRVQVIAGGLGCDTILVYFKAKSPVWPFDLEESSFNISVAKGYGLEWVVKELGVSEDLICTIEG
ncbi:hypothetical protein N9043_00905 [bacterium]|nr:hypothetical protein [bacterium]